MFRHLHNVRYAGMLKAFTSTKTHFAGFDFWHFWLRATVKRIWKLLLPSLLEFFYHSPVIVNNQDKSRATSGRFKQGR